MKLNFLFCAGLLIIVSVADAKKRTRERRHSLEKWTRDPKLVIFGNSLSDQGRRFEAPASFEFEGIGVAPWKKIFAANDSEDLVEAFSRGSVSGSVTNGKAWPDWLGVDQELNFATSSASMSASFRSRETCYGYTGEGEEFPTGILDEQINRYVHDILIKTSATLGHVHVIILGANDISHLLGAFSRYNIGQVLQESGAFGEDVYEDPVPFEKVFELVDSVPQLTPEPLISDVITALSSGVTSLLEAGVTGRIFVGNVPSSRMSPDSVESGLVDVLEPIALAINVEILAIVEGNDQLGLLDLYTLTASIVDEPDTWTELSFVAPEDEDSGESLPLGTPCFAADFSVDSTAEIMGTQALRSIECQEECALCADDTSPCQVCYVGNPSATICADPDTRIMWDTIHGTTALYRLLGKAIKECVGKYPDYDQPLVNKLCPDDIDY